MRSKTREKEVSAWPGAKNQRGNIQWFFGIPHRTGMATIAEDHLTLETKQARGQHRLGCARGREVNRGTHTRFSRHSPGDRRGVKRGCCGKSATLFGHPAACQGTRQKKTRTQQVYDGIPRKEKIKHTVGVIKLVLATNDINRRTCYLHQSPVMSTIFRPRGKDRRT